MWKTSTSFDHYQCFKGGYSLNPEHQCSSREKTILSTLRHWNYDQLTTKSEECKDHKGTWFWCRRCRKPVFVEFRVGK